MGTEILMLSRRSVLGGIVAATAGVDHKAASAEIIQAAKTIDEKVLEIAKDMERMHGGQWECHLNHEMKTIYIFML